MSALRSLRCLTTRVAMNRPRLASNVNMGMRRQYSTTPKKVADEGHNPLLWVGCISLGIAYTYYQKKQGEKLALLEGRHDISETKTETKHEPNETVKGTPVAKLDSKNIDYQQVYNDIAALLDSNPDYDDGSYGPVLFRLAWHSSGTYDKKDNTGGSGGGTIRFKAESSHPANKGLEIARDLLHEKIKPKYPELSYGDMYTLGGVVAVQELGGPDIKWRPGRQDQGENKVTPDGRLPDGALNRDHARNVFYRMGFNDQEIVALIGGHVLGRCHLDRSGYDGPWQEAPTFFSNEYYKAITSREWVKRDLPTKGLWQWVDKNNPEVMMLPIEISMLHDEKLGPYFQLYAKDQDKFYHDFALAFKKLIELGVPFTGKEKEYVFKRVNV
ncbi:heme peroxidase [Pilaira anomala]|nr:heme peroxidase [Pilaira anomala]